jgi:hypothetical protein
MKRICNLHVCIQPLPIACTGWTIGHQWRHPHAVPTIELTDIELTEAARGVRCLAAQARADAERQGKSSTREIFERGVRFHEEMAKKFEQARTSRESGQSL